MRYSALVLAATGALAQELHTTVLTIGYTNSAGSAVTATTTYVYEYSNPVTSLLTQTNSDGIITGGAATFVATAQASVVTSQPSVVTSQPDVATIPAGLGTGTHTITLPAASGTGVTAFTISVGSSTTEVLSSTPTQASGTDGSSATGTGAGASGATGTGTSASASASQSGNAAAALAPVSFGLVSLGALVAALF